jgi:hypothetical protein
VKPCELMLLVMTFVAVAMAAFLGALFGTGVL